jgi:hypothetical protein
MIFWMMHLAILSLAVASLKMMGILLRLPQSHQTDRVLLLMHVLHCKTPIVSYQTLCH